MTKDGGRTGAPDSLHGRAVIPTWDSCRSIRVESSLTDAIAKYGDAAKDGVEHAMRELQEMRRQASSSLVIPQGGVPNLGGGGKIQLP